MIKFLLNGKVKLLLLVLSTLFFIFTLFGEKGIVKYLKLSSESKQLEAETSRFEKENLNLLKEVNSYKNDMKFIESLARKELGLAKENEIIYQFKENQ